MRVLTSSILFCLLLTMPGHAQPPAPDGTPPPREGGPGPGGPAEGFRGGPPFISPMGEQFRGAEDMGAAAIWFAGADANHDGILSEAEMVADAERFFALLDVDGDGRLNGTEVSRYETEIAPLVQGRGFGDAGGGRRGGGRRGGGGHPGGGGGMGGGGVGADMGGAGGMGDMGGMPQGGRSGSSSKPAYDDVRQGAARFSYLNIAEPVASADINLNFIVAAQEFRDTARTRFRQLDPNHDGQIALSELPAMPSPRRR